jgi:serine protease Do
VTKPALPAARRRLVPLIAGSALLFAGGVGVSLAFQPRFEAGPAAPQASEAAVPDRGAITLVKDGSEPGLADLVEKLMPSVVNIATVTGGPTAARPDARPDAPYEEYFREFFERNQDPRRAAAVGSGFVIDTEGHIVTNNHVIQNSTEVKVIFSDGTSVPAKVVGRDPRADLAVLKIATPMKLQPASWGKSATVRIGDSVVAIGNPFGLGGTVTTGIISALHRHLNNFGGIPGSSFVDFLQTDAAINKGNSGGPLFNMKGEVIGINTAIYSRQGTNVGIAFAVPSDLAAPIIEQLKKHGRTKRGWLGVQIKDIDDDVAKAMGLKSKAGALVVNAIPGGPAAEAGVLAGDVIVRFDGKAVPNERRLPQIVAATEVGRTVDLVVIRKGSEVTLKIKLGELEKAMETGALDPKKEETKPVDGTAVLGMKLSEITPELRQRYNLREGEGVVVVEVDAKSQAGEKQIKAGDVIVEMDLTKVTKPAEAVDLLKKAEQGRKTSVLLLVQRGDDRRFVALRIGGDAQPK